MGSIVFFISLFIYISTKSVFNMLVWLSEQIKILLLNFYFRGLIDDLI